MVPDIGSDSHPHRVVIVGGGAAGLELATALGDIYGTADGMHRKAEIILVERGRTHLWKPLLHSVAAGSLDRSQHELSYMAQAHWHHFTYRLGAMCGLDRVRKVVQIEATLDEEGREVVPPREVGYDTLVVAIGSVTNDFGTPGAAAHAVPLETLAQASRFHRNLVNACLRANTQPGPVRPGQLHIAIIGAGATGTELAAELHRTVRAVVAFGLDRIVPERDIRIILIEASPRILPALPERISLATQALLMQLGVEVRTGTKVTEVRADGVVLEGGEVVPSELVVWSAGVKAPDFLQGIGGLETNRINQLMVKPTLQVTLDDDIFAIGDCCACPRPGFPGNVPPRAQASHQMASHMVEQIAARFAGRPLKDYAYRDFGSLVSLGKFSTVGSLMGFVIGRSMFIEGHFARLMYRSLYKMHQSALHGHAPVLWRTLMSLMSGRGEPEVKLH